MVRCLLVNSGLPPKSWGSSCSLRLISAIVCHTPGDMKTPFKRLYGKDANLSHPKIIGARAFVHIKDAKKLEAGTQVLGRNAVRLQRGRNALLPGLEPENSQGGGEQECDVHRDSATSYSAIYTTLSAPGVAASGIGRRLRFNRRSAVECTGITPRFLTSTSTFRPNTTMPTA